MKLVTYRAKRELRAGIVVDGHIVDLERAAAALNLGRLPASVRELLEGGPAAMRRADRLQQRARKHITPGPARAKRPPDWLTRLKNNRLAPPLPDPQKIICLGMNYLDHCREQQGRLGRTVDPPTHPIIFSKFATTLTGPFDPICMPPRRISTQIDYEVELAVVIGRTARRVPQKTAMDYVAGYMVINDVSARDCQFNDKQWVRAKSFDTFAPCGPWLVTAKEVGNPHRLKLWTRVNGCLLQDGSTRNLIFRIPKIISFLSQGLTLHPGDVISTGTPSGVGAFRDPPNLLRPGDLVECGIERIGEICNRCRRD